VPISYTAAFRNAQGAVKDGYDVALIVGPEGIAYAPMFEDLGIETLVINIPEDSPDGPRTFTVLSDLERLRGKRVLVVEDDVVSGATLRKILEETAPFSPASFGLFLGYPGQQMLGNVPGEFEKVYTTSVDSDKDEAVFGEFLNEHEPVFKKQVQGLINPQTGSSGTLPGE
jgi:hypothetical protein